MNKSTEADMIVEQAKRESEAQTKPLIATVTCDVGEESVVVVLIDLAVQVDVEAAGHTGLALAPGKSSFGEMTAKVQVILETWDRPGKSSFGEITAKVQVMPNVGLEGVR